MDEARKVAEMAMVDAPRLRAQRNRLDSQVKDLEAQNAKLRADLRSREDHIKEREALFAKIQEEKDRAMEEVLMMEPQIRGMEDKIRRLEAQVMDISNQLSWVEARRTAVERDAGALRARLNQAEERLSKAATDLEAKDREATNLRAEVRLLEDKKVEFYHRSWNNCLYQIKRDDPRVELDFSKLDRFHDYVFDLRVDPLEGAYMEVPKEEEEYEEVGEGEEEVPGVTRGNVDFVPTKQATAGEGEAVLEAPSEVVAPLLSSAIKDTVPEVVGGEALVGVSPPDHGVEVVPSLTVVPFSVPNPASGSPCWW